MEKELTTLKQRINSIDTELHTLKANLASIELGLGISDAKRAKAAGDWLELAKATSAKWSDKSLTSVEIARAGRKHA